MLDLDIWRRRIYCEQLNVNQGPASLSSVFVTFFSPFGSL